MHKDFVAIRTQRYKSSIRRSRYPSIQCHRRRPYVTVTKVLVAQGEVAPAVVGMARVGEVQVVLVSPEKELKTWIKIFCQWNLVAEVEGCESRYWLQDL